MAMTLAVLLVIYVIVGRDDHLLTRATAIPAGLRSEEAGELVGRMGRVWGGDNFEFGDANALHYFFITGVDCPEPGQSFHVEANQFLIKNYQDKILNLTIDGYDDLKREFGHAIHIDEKGGQTDIGLELVRHGMAWYDGGKFEGCRTYQEAFRKAQKEQIGLWADPDPVPPWEFYAQQISSLK